MSSYHEMRRRKRRREEEEKRRKQRAAARRAEEHHRRDLQGENLYEFIKTQFPGLPHMTDARNMSPETLIRYMKIFNKSIRAEDNYLARWAAAHGNLPLLQTLYDLGADLSDLKNYVPRALAGRAHIDGLLWLRETGMEIKPYLQTVLIVSVNINDIARMDRLLEIEPALSVQHHHAINLAAATGNIHMLEWFHSHGAVFDYNDHECGGHALRGGHVPALDYLEKRGVNMAHHAREAAPHAAAEGKTAALAWLDARNIPYDLNECARRAAHGRHTALVRQLYNRGARLPDRIEASIIFNAECEGEDDLRDFFIAKRNARNAHYVTEAVNAALTESRTATRPTITRRIFGKFGLGGS